MTIYSCVFKENVEYMLVFKGQVTALDFMMEGFLWQLLELGLDVLLIALRKPYVCLVLSTSTFEGNNKLFVPQQCTVPFQQFWDSTFKRFHETHDLVRWHYLRSTYLPWHMNPSTLCWPGDRGFHRLQCFLDLFEILFLVSTTVQYHLGICMHLFVNHAFDLMY